METFAVNKLLCKEIIAGLVPMNTDDLDNNTCLYEIGFDDIDLPSLSQRIGVWGLNDDMTIGEVLDLAAATKSQNEKEKA